MSSRAASRSTLFLLVALTAAACSGDSTGPVPEPPACDVAGGVTHTTDIADEVWRQNDNPHRVPGTLHITGPLTIEPGALICAGPDAGLVIASSDAWIDARGTAAEPIVFTADDPSTPWGGIHATAECTDGFCVRTASVISNARIEHARQGIVTGDAVRIDSVHFRQIRCTAARVHHIARSRVDSAGRDGCAAVEVGVAASRGGTDVFEDVVIRGSGGDGLHVRVFGLPAEGVPPGSVEILGGRIEGSAGVGLRFGPQYRGGNVSAARPVRIVGGADVPVWGPLDAVATIWPALTDQDSLRGNAGDTAVVWGHPVGLSEIVLGPAVVWQPRTNFQQPQILWGADMTVRLEPGAHLDLRADLRTAGGSFIAGRSNAAPVRITGTGAVLLECEASGSSCGRGSRITNARLEGVQLTSQQYIVIDDARARMVRLEIGGSGSTVTRITVEDALGPTFLVFSAVRISNCIVRNNAFYGIIVYASGAGSTIHNCAFQSNRNAGVWNAGSSTLDARFNWWGDPAGPLGPEGDGIQGSVDYSAFLTTPPAGGAIR